VFSQYLQDARGYPPLVAGVYALPAGLAQFVVATTARPLVSRFGVRTVLAGGLVASAAGLVVLAASGGASAVWVFEVGLGLLGVGIGLTMPPATAAIMSSLPAAQAGVGSAMNNLVRELGGAFGIGLLGSITLLRYQHGLPAVAPAAAGEGLAQAFAVDGRESGLGLVAREAYSAGLDLAMLAGAAVVVVCAVVTFVGLWDTTAVRPSPTAVAQPRHGDAVDRGATPTRSGSR
jgi:MFS family permease